MKLLTVIAIASGMMLILMILAVCMASSKLSRIEESMMKCYGCICVDTCHMYGIRLCEEEMDEGELP